MKYLELRRHSKRVIPGDHLSQAGVNLARRVGEAMGPFGLVITSTLPRAFQTAIAMGFAVQGVVAGEGGLLLFALTGLGKMLTERAARASVGLAGLGVSEG